ncbi:unnamed protein product [Parnassius mnemosyne]|uniref:Reverse transcriptase domain-containing protein n=2 Tax=Parnassius mnemosyne TaxID=213953 RepID=A0AAV1L8I7_9NEOP
MANEFTLCTWNLRTLYRPAGLQLLCQQLANHRADITAVQELRWLGHGVIDKPDFAIYYSCNEKHHTFGTGFVVSKRLKHLVIDFQPINECMCKIRLKGKFQNYTIINVHAPTEDTDLEEKERWYSDVESVYSNSPKGDIKIIIGDMNAKVGRESIYRPTIGSHSLHKTSNDNGTRLIDLATSLGMVVGSTRFPHKNIHKITWVSADNVTRNQIDHILIDGRHCSNLLDVRSRRGANIDSDHHLVVCKIRARISRYKYTKTVRTKKIETTRLKREQDVKYKYMDTVHRELMKVGERNSNSIGDPDSTWRNLKGVLSTAASEILGFEEKPKRNDWFDDECQKITNEKNDAYRLMQQKYTRGRGEEYKKRRRREKHLHKRKKRSYEEQQLREIASSYTQKETRNFYNQVNGGRKEFKPRTTACRSKNGQLLNDKDEIVQRWAEYFRELLNSSVQTRPLSVPVPQALLKNQQTDESLYPTIEDTKRAIQSIKNNKSPGMDDIQGELIKYAGTGFEKEFHHLVLQIWNNEKMADDWNTSVICPLHKKGDILDCNNYRGISLLNTGYKVFANMLFNKLKPYVESSLGEYQCGFRPNRSTVDQIFSLRQILEKTFEYNVNTHHLFVDFKAAYDNVHRSFLYQAMMEIGIPTKLVRLTEMTLRNSQSVDRVQTNVSEPFRTNDGLRQGDALSCLLFNIALDKCIRDSKIETKGTIYHKSVQILGYADDLDVIGRSLPAMESAYLALEKSAAEAGLQVNMAKTKYLKASKDQQILLQGVNIGNNTFASVNDHVYLGSLVTDNNDVSSEISRRIMAANKCYFGLLRYLRSKLLSRSIKLLLYETLLRPILTYGSECWVLSKKDENSLLVFERKILRRIFGAVMENERWRTRYNHELYQMYDEPNVIKTIKIGRLRWAGHVLRMDEARVPKRLLEG